MLVTISRTIFKSNEISGTPPLQRERELDTNTQTRLDSFTGSPDKKSSLVYYNRKVTRNDSDIKNGSNTITLRRVNSAWCSYLCNYENVQRAHLSSSYAVRDWGDALTV